jgi:hypothetical protein
MAEAGADALELNVYSVSGDPEEDAGAVERRTVEMVSALKAQLRIRWP